MEATNPQRMTDKVVTSAGFKRPATDGQRIVGHGVATVYDPDGNIKQQVEFTNLITDRGDEFYAKLGVAVAQDAVSGMRLGTGNTAPAKNGAGAAIVTYVTASNKALDGTYPQNSDLGAGLGWRDTYRTTWNPGEATANGIEEVVITNENPLTDVAGTAANTISRALLAPVVNKGAGDTLEVTWHHDFLGA